MHHYAQKFSGYSIDTPSIFFFAYLSIFFESLVDKTFLILKFIVFIITGSIFSILLCETSSFG